jgi:hypothetical protein
VAIGRLVVNLALRWDHWGVDWLLAQKKLEELEKRDSYFAFCLVYQNL